MQKLFLGGRLHGRQGKYCYIGDDMLISRRPDKKTKSLRADYIDGFVIRRRADICYRYAQG